MKVAIVLAGGMGTRLNMKKPKAMLRIGHKTLIQHQLEWLDKQGFEEVFVCVGYLHKMVKFALHELKLNVRRIIESDPLGTGGAVRNVYERYPDICKDGVLVVNVDDLCFHKVDCDRKQTTIFCKRLPFSVWINNVMFAQNEAYQHVGHTFISVERLILLPRTGSLEKTLAMWSKEDEVKCASVGVDWITMNDLEQYREARRSFPFAYKRWLKDGTV